MFRASIQLAVQSTASRNDKPSPPGIRDGSDAGTICCVRVRVASLGGGGSGLGGEGKACAGSFRKRNPQGVVVGVDDPLLLRRTPEGSPPVVLEPPCTAPS